MKKNLLLILTFGIFSIMVAQIQCSYNELKNYRQSLDSNFLNKFKHQRIKDVNKALSAPQPSFKPYVNPPNTYSMMGVTTNSNAHYVIPIAIHVVHDGSAVGTGCNISDAQIINQINELNNYFAPYHIQFCPASVLPDSFPFSGITRTENALTNYRMGIDNDALMSIDVLPQDKYLNIWIVKSILNDDGSPSNRVGSAYSPLGEKLGIAIRFDFFGNYTTCGSCNLNSASRGKVLVHKV